MFKVDFNYRPRLVESSVELSPREIIQEYYARHFHDDGKAKSLTDAYIDALRIHVGDK